MLGANGLDRDPDGWAPRVSLLPVVVGLTDVARVVDLKLVTGAGRSAVPAELPLPSERDVVALVG